MEQTVIKEPQQVENMRAKEAARFLACGVSTIWLWVKQGKIKAYKLSDRVTIFKRSELETLIRWWCSMKKDTVTINGKEAIITHRQSLSKQKEQPKIYTQKVMRALELLLKGDRSTTIENGINTLNTFTTMEGNNTLNDTRVSNAIVELRKIIPKSGLLTFRYMSDNTDRYALMNDKNIINFADNLLEKIQAKISKEV